MRGAGRFLGDAVLSLAAFGGFICVLLVILAFVFNVSLIMFKTGSMAPTIPAGSLAVVREIPAPEIRVGDVVTVDRPAALPITHRVTSVAGGPSPAERVITMKGDANEAEDPGPYTVGNVRIVMGSVPNLAYGVVWLSSPWVLALLTLGASGLVTWAFWPREADGRDETGDGERVRVPGQPENDSHSALVFLVAPLALGFALAAPAQTTTEEIVASGNLRMTSIGDRAAMAHLAPGEPVQWQVGVAAEEPGTGVVRIELLGNGNAGLGLHAAIRSCDERWVEETCTGATDKLQVAGPIAVDGAKRQLTTMSAGEERWLLFDLWLPEASAPDAAGGPVHLQVHASGSGDDVNSSPGPVAPLAPTGTNPILALFAAVGSVGLGLALAGAARMRRKRNQ
ncbi:signal peptidase I [Paeniglutamicibacter sp. ORCA_105]|uniref:signal peptidase I n=1 Tax=Paeniglutamicibacter sp. ORCA_105 TaxID=3377336 RepID=UPI003895AD8C